MSSYLIYGLVDPRTGELRYIGRSSSGYERPKAHWIPSSLKKDKTYCGNWCKNLLKENLIPEIIIIEELTKQEELNEAETFWICYFKSLGAKLTNLTNGGWGHNGYKQTQKHKENFVKSIKKTLEEKPEIKQKYIEQLNKNRANPEIRKRQGKSMSKYWSNLENRERVSKGHKERAKDPKVKENLKRANLLGIEKLKNPVIELSTGIAFESIREAANCFGLNESDISAIVRGKRETVKGRKFKSLKYEK